MWGCFFGRNLCDCINLVFPTHVGVFPPFHPVAMMYRSLPHACGGVSFPDMLGIGASRSSPRMWGCFSKDSGESYSNHVFPTHVGVFLAYLYYPQSYYCLPHACGGVSKATEALKRVQESSPRMWGCFHLRKIDITLFPVFPTHVGVFLSAVAVQSNQLRLPHACGGVSTSATRTRLTTKSSPRMWGCFWSSTATGKGEGVFPTHVGVFLFWIASLQFLPRLPHACGGVSLAAIQDILGMESSPRMWGCFYF